jgi:hypothetical protein
VAGALAGAGWAALRTPAAPAEAAILAGAPACAGAAGPRDALAVVACALPGAAAAHAALARAAARLGGLTGARGLGAVAAAALALLAWRAGASPRWGRRGPLAAVTFVALGAPLQLVATVHPRGVAALLLAGAAALLEPTADGDRPPGPVRAALAGAALGLAATATPVALCVLPLALALAPLRRDRAATAALAAAAVAVLAVSATAAGPGAWAGLAEALRAGPPGGWAAAAPRLALLVDGLAMPLLLSTFAVFHRDGRERAAASVAVAAAVALAPLLSARPEDLRTAQLLAFVILGPASAVGVARLSETFAAGNPSRLARPFFAAATLLVAGVHGVHLLRTLAEAAR